MITGSDIQKATEIYDKAYEIANFVSKKYIGKNASIGGVEISQDWIYVSGDECWSYGGHDTFELQFPSTLLIIDNWQTEADKLVQSWVDEDNKKRGQEAIKKQQDKEEQERKQYEKLKQKFEK